jgi:hypothetical protein
MEIEMEIHELIPEGPWDDGSGPDDSLQGCRESDRIAEGLYAMGKPTYGKNAIQHCYMCHAWCRGDIFIVTAVDINGKELCWKYTKDLAEVGSIVREFSGV